MLTNFESSSLHPTVTASSLNKETLQGGSRAECTIYRCKSSALNGLECQLRSTETANPNTTLANRKNRKQQTACRLSGLHTSFVGHQEFTPVSRKLEHQRCSDNKNSIGAKDLGKHFCCGDETSVQCDWGRKTLKIRGRLTRTSSKKSRKRYNSLNKLLGLPGEPIVPAKHVQVVAASSTPVTQERCTDDILRRAREEAWTMATRQSMYIIARYRCQVAKLQSQASGSTSHSNGSNAKESDELRSLRAQVEELRAAELVRSRLAAEARIATYAKAGDGSRLEAVSCKVVRKWLRMELHVAFSRWAGHVLEVGRRRAGVGRILARHAVSVTRTGLLRWARARAEMAEMARLRDMEDTLEGRIRRDFYAGLSLGFLLPDQTMAHQGSLASLLPDQTMAHQGSLASLLPAPHPHRAPPATAGPGPAEAHVPPGLAPGSSHAEVMGASGVGTRWRLYEARSEPGSGSDSET